VVYGPAGFLLEFPSKKICSERPYFEVRGGKGGRGEGVGELGDLCIFGLRKT